MMEHHVFYIWLWARQLYRCIYSPVRLLRLTTNCFCGIFSICFFEARTVLCYLELILILLYLVRKQYATKWFLTKDVSPKNITIIFLFDDFDIPTLVQIETMRKIFLFVFIIFISQGFKIKERAISKNIDGGLQAQGLSINSEVKAFLLNLISNAFLYNGEDAAANAYYITQKLNNSTYTGNWNIVIAVNCTYPSGYGAYSAQGSWWAYWNKVNQYALDWCYYLTKMPSTAAKYANKSGSEIGVGQGITQDEIEVINKVIQKGYSIYKGSQNGNAFFVSQETGIALGGSWDVLVLNATSQFYSSSYSISEKWQNLNGVTELDRRYFIRKVWNQS